ncbi:MAG: GNAT family N-acetyltransferase, partial [Chloroflexia bacterium]
VAGGQPRGDRGGAAEAGYACKVGNLVSSFKLSTNYAETWNLKLNLRSMMSEKQSQEVALRAWAEGDLELEMRLMGDAEITKFLGGPESEEKIRSRHEMFLRMNDGDEGRMFVIVVGPERTTAGSVGYWEKEWNHQTMWETGWFVLPEFQGQGLATIGTLLLAEEARSQKKHRYLHAFPGVENGASNAICRKAGFTFMGEYKFEYPKGSFMQCNDWRLDLFGDSGETN